MISVAGAGPAGCIAAACCAKDHETVIYELQDTAERRIQCAGLISRTGFERLSIKPSERFVRNTVRGARIYSPDGSLLTVSAKTDKAFVVDRREFDNHLLEKATDAGAKVINDAVDEKNIGEIRKKSEKVVVATGTNYNLHRILGIQKPKRFLYAAQYELKVECDKDFVEMYLNVPGFFTWIIPAEDRARAGLCTQTNPTPFLERFIKDLKSKGRIKDETILGRSYGIIPVHDPKMPTQYPGISLVGDAAGHVKATTGGGVVMGGIAAGLAICGDYEKRWRKETGKELQTHLYIRRFLDNLSEKNTDKLIKLLNKNRAIIEEKGDMDKASVLLKSLFANPRFTASFLYQTPGYLLDMMH